MDKLTAITDKALIAANVIAIVSLEIYFWTTRDVAADADLEFISSSITLWSRLVGYTPDVLPKWLLAGLLLSVVIGLMSLTNCVIQLATRIFDREIPYAREVGFAAVIVFLATPIFRVAFHVDEIGG